MMTHYANGVHLLSENKSRNNEQSFSATVFVFDVAAELNVHLNRLLGAFLPVRST